MVEPFYVIVPTVRPSIQGWLVRWFTHAIEARAPNAGAVLRDLTAARESLSHVVQKHFDRVASWVRKKI